MTPGRFELPTCGLGNRCSIHLSYGATFIINHLQHTSKLLLHLNSLQFTRLANGLGRKSELKTKRTRYQQGSIQRIQRANGYAGRVRFSDLKYGKSPKSARRSNLPSSSRTGLLDVRNGTSCSAIDRKTRGEWRENNLTFSGNSQVELAREFPHCSP